MLEAFKQLGVDVNEFSVRALYQQIEDKNFYLKKEMQAKITFDSTDLRNSVCEFSDIDLLPVPLTLEISKNLFYAVLTQSRKVTKNIFADISLPIIAKKYQNVTFFTTKTLRLCFFVPLC